LRTSDDKKEWPDVPSEAVGELVMEALRTLDDVA